MLSRPASLAGSAEALSHGAGVDRDNHRVGRVSRLKSIVIIAGILTLVTGCAGGAAAPGAGTDGTAGTASTAPEPGGNAGDANAEGTRFSIDHLTSCEQVAPMVATYIDGLAAYDDEVNEWGVYCRWDMAEGETDFANNRSVSVTLTPLGADEVQPDTSVVVRTGGEVIDDAWLAARGGVAYSTGVMTSVAGAVSTTVWLPGVEAMIGGGRWAEMPSLDGPAAIEAVKGLVREAR